MISKIGIFFTLAFVTLWTYVVYSRLDDFVALSLNELGDFLSGTVGSIALLWLVLGYFQQGRELKNSNESLKLQAVELKNSVDQQRAMVNVSREAIEQEKARVKELESQRTRDLDPTFLLGFGFDNAQDGLTSAYQYSFHMRGRPISEITFLFEADDGEVYKDQLEMCADDWRGGEKQIRFLDGRRLTGSVIGKIQYKRDNSTYGEQLFRFSIPDAQQSGVGFFPMKRIA